MTPFDKQWVFTVYVPAPNMISLRGPGGLANPDNWNLEGFDESNWDATALVGADAFPKLREAAPDEAIIELRGETGALVATDDRAWFDRFFQSSTQLDFVVVHQEPGRPSRHGEDELLYSYDHTGLI